MRAQFAMIRVINRDQRIDAGGRRGLQFLFLQLPAIGRQHPDAVGLQPDCRLVQIDNLDAGHGAQYVLRRLDDAGDPGMTMQRNPHRHALAQKRP